MARARRPGIDDGDCRRHTASKARERLGHLKREHGADEYGKTVQHQLAGARVAEKDVQRPADPPVQRLVPERSLAALEPVPLHEDAIGESLERQRVVAEQIQPESADASEGDGRQHREPRDADEQPRAASCA